MLSQEQRVGRRVDLLREALAAAGVEVRAVLSELVARHADDAVERFYDVLLTDAEASLFLSHEVVQNRLRRSVSGWLGSLFRLEPDGDLEPWVRGLHDVGMRHARINIPMYLLALGMRTIKRELGLRLTEELPAEQVGPAMLVVHDLLDQAVDGMNDAYIGNLIAHARQHQSLRFFLAGHGLALECERLKGLLYKWHRQTVLALLHPDGAIDPPPIARSDFAMWVAHKAELALGDVDEVRALQASLRQVERLVEQARGTNGSATPGREVLEALDDAVDEAAFVMSGVAEKAMQSEAGRDPLTRLLNRRYLSSILQQEVGLSVHNGKRFGLLLADVDSFKQINDSLGHPAGDVVLTSVADLLLNQVRVSDFVFRHGGDEFLVIFTDVGDEVLARRAEQIRRCIEDRQPTIDGLERVTVSVGVAMHDGHPDYERTLTAADQALLEAKRQGRNRVVVSAAAG